MKKLLIPIIGLLVLIFLTPVILGKMANSNIDKKIEKFKKEGVKIVEVKKDISYLKSFREFKVDDVLVDLNFKNLPVTNAIFDIKYKDSHMHVVLNNFKKFVFTINNHEGYYKDHQFYINGQVYTKSNLDENSKKLIQMIGKAIDRIQQKNS